MMALDKLNTLDVHPLPGLDEFVDQCVERQIAEVNLTGTNTDPSLYRHSHALREYLEKKIPNLCFGIRTNAVASQLDWTAFDKASVTICSFDPDIYEKMMGQGEPPNIKRLICDAPIDLKINVVLGPENVKSGDIFLTLDACAEAGVSRVNLREPYGQPHIGNPLENFPVRRQIFGMPAYLWKSMEITYWDVHYCEIESVNLYASGRVSTAYPITKGHDKSGTVKGQSNFKAGRLRSQWLLT